MKRLALMAGVLALVVALAGSVDALAARKTGPAPTLRKLVRQTKALPRSLGTKKQHRALLNAATKSRRSSKKHACVSVRQLSRYRRVLARIRPKKGKRFGRVNAKLERLGPTSLEASRRLLFTKKTKRCGGGKKPNNRKQPVTKILSSDENGMHLEVLLPAMRFGTQTGGGKAWTELSMPNTDSPQDPGKPGIPVISKTFAMPDGSTLSVDPGKTSSYVLGGVKVYPAQPDPADADTQAPNFFAPPFATPAFELNRTTYSNNSLFPAQPAAGDTLGNFRDLKLGGLQVAGAQYRPESQTLKVLTSVEVTLRFNGGPHTFNPEIASPWEYQQRQLTESLLNKALIKRLRDVDILRRCGEEMLVVTNPATLASANSFANARQAAGIRTKVVQTGTASGQIGDTSAAIQTYIRGELTRFLCRHPSYVTIMGDDDLVPTNFVTASPGCCGYSGGIPSDLPYAMRDDADEIPDVAVGRILGNDNAATQTVVNKIVGYENSPPAGTWLRHATVAAQFQDDNGDGQEERTFVWFAETVRRGLSGLGMQIDRVYHDSPNTTPLKFNDGTDLPSSLQKPTFPWTGSGTDVSNDWNDGRFLMVHRDHGYSDGWGTPGYGTADVQALHNGNKLPVLLSINCSSAAYDYDDTSFVSESLVNPNGGSVGAFGDTRDSPTWHNSQIALGFADALLPRILPSEGPATKQRTGNALINGKIRLAGLSSPATDGNSRNELLLWHYFGDPSMQMWGGDPIVINPDLINAVFTRAFAADGAPYGVNVTVPAELAGQTISLLRNGEVVGKANIGPDGKATIPAEFGDGSPTADELQVAMEPDGAEPVRAPVHDAPLATKTTISNCPAAPIANNNPYTFRGSLSPAGAGKSIVLRYTPPDAPAFERTVQADANGNWQNPLEAWPDDPNGTGVRGQGTWKLQARFAGDSGYAPSSSSECTFQVYDAA